MTTLKLNNRYPFLFENFFNESDYLPKTNFKSLPSVNVVEKTDGFVLEVAAPGLKKEDFKINFHENKLTISAESTVSNEETDKKYTRKEFSFNQFQRTFTLPQTVDVDKIEASYVDGVLNISIP
ncbi:MAG: Hsp20/alpha crystallin family protein, partial [Bacteroidota bacterium]